VSYISRRLFHRLALMGVGNGLRFRKRFLFSLVPPTVPLQPLAAQIKRLITALESIGEPLPKECRRPDLGVRQSMRILAFRKFSGYWSRMCC
jgi:hypothetical protein